MFLLKSKVKQTKMVNDRSSHPEVFLGKGVLKICGKFTVEYPCRSVISIKLLCNFIETALWHGCSPVNLMHIFRTSFLRNTSGWLLLDLVPLTVSQLFYTVHEVLIWFYSHPEWLLYTSQTPRRIATILNLNIATSQNKILEKNYVLGMKGCLIFSNEYRHNG